MNPKIISRIAPTPSGFLHAGNIYNFLLTYLFTRAFDGILYLRIDDYDLLRYRREFVENIFRALEMLGIVFDGGPSDATEFEAKFSSKFRLEAYQNALKKLERNGLCYACSCSHSMRDSFQNGVYTRVCLNKNLKFKKNETALRLRVGDDAQIYVGQNLADFDALSANESAWGLENRANFGFKFDGENAGSLGASYANSASKDKFSGWHANGENVLLDGESGISVENSVDFVSGNDQSSGESNNQNRERRFSSATENEAGEVKFSLENASNSANKTQACLLERVKFASGQSASNLTSETEICASARGNFADVQNKSNSASQAAYFASETEKFSPAQSVNLAQILGDFVVWKKDDTPAYNLASLVDDEMLGVNLLVRGEDLLACSAAQKYAAGILGYDFADANFIHHGLLTHGGKKLSKSSRAPAVSVTDGAKMHYKFAAARLGLDASKCDSLSNLLEMFREKFKI